MSLSFFWVIVCTLFILLFKEYFSSNVPLWLSKYHINLLYHVVQYFHIRFLQNKLCQLGKSLLVISFILNISPSCGVNQRMKKMAKLFPLKKLQIIKRYKIWMEEFFWCNPQNSLTDQDTCWTYYLKNLHQNHCMVTIYYLKTQTVNW